jgi:hypothetical protein
LNKKVQKLNSMPRIHFKAQVPYTTNINYKISMENSITDTFNVANSFFHSHNAHFIRCIAFFIYWFSVALLLCLPCTRRVCCSRIPSPSNSSSLFFVDRHVVELPPFSSASWKIIFFLFFLLILHKFPFFNKYISSFIVYSSLKNK